MKKMFFLGLLAILAYLPLEGQATRRAPQQGMQQAQPQQSNVNRFFVGGGLGLTFGNYTRIAVQPIVGYQVTEPFSVGTRLNYEYIKDKRFLPEITASNYGAGIFARYRVFRNLYVHAEPAYYSYKFSIDNGDSVREWVPFLFLGGGFIQPVGGRSAFFVEVLFDVIQDSNSPYRNWQPLITMGMTAGF